MRKTPSYLKGLAETRARAAADILRYKQVIDEIMVSLAKAQAELEACDTLIKKFDDRLDPTQVEPINHWQGRYGKRGALLLQGLNLSAKVLANKVNRGTFTLAFFLRCMAILKVDRVRLTDAK